MANNQNVNKVQYGSQVLIDLTSDTVTPDKLLSGYTAHDASGAQITGTYSGGTQTGTVTQDANGYLVLDDDAPSGQITVESLSVTQNGTYTAPTGKAYSPVTVSVSGGGGGDMADPIRFFDYDGTLVASYSSVPSSLPSVPTHTGLTNGAWNYTLQQITTQFNAMGTCDVGANYETVSGATEIDIELQEGRLHPYLSLAVNGTVSIDWDDNSTPDTSTGTSLTTRLADIHHEYAAAGSYTIKITLTSGTGYSLRCTNAYFLLNKNNSTASMNRVYSNCVQAVRIGEDCTIGDYAFYNCHSLSSVSIPSGVTSIGTYAFYQCFSLVFISIPSNVTIATYGAFNYCYSLVSVSIPSTVTSIESSAFQSCYSLASVSIPSGVTTISGSAFQSCYSLASVSIPSGVTTIGGSAFGSCYSLASVSIPSGVTTINSGTFQNCYSLASVSIPSGITTIGSSAFYNCYSLASILIPSEVTSIAAQAFNNCYGIAEYHFKPTTPPTLANTNAFTSIQSDCVIYVPSSKLNDYKTAENWSTYASYMVGE